jgi:hypothetical protein
MRSTTAAGELPDVGRSSDWHTYVLLDEGFYDCTMGTCPAGHRRTVDD